jgi:transcriptional regulator with XRE-family HTH domain
VIGGMIFGEKLQSERKNRGWSQEELAEKLFVSQQSVSKWETGQKLVSNWLI